MRRLARIPRPSPAVIVAIVAVFVAASGLAVAAIPSRNGVIHACYKKKGGALRAVSGGKCPKGSRALAWNQRGLTGGRGATGPPGSTGPQGTPGAKGDAGTAVAYARVAADGSLEPGDGGKQNKSVVSADVQKADTGVLVRGHRRPADRSGTGRRLSGLRRGPPGAALATPSKNSTRPPRLDIGGAVACR